MALCILCREREATIPDRNTMSLRKKVCSVCHSQRLTGDLKVVLALHEKKKKEGNNG